VLTDPFRYIFKVSATVTLLIPIISGIFSYKYLNKYLKIFFYFLVYSLLNDLLGWVLNVKNNIIAINIYNLYLLIESVVLLWFISKTSKSLILRRYSFKLLIILAPLWLIFDNVLYGFPVYSTLYDIVYLILLSLICGFSCITIIESEMNTIEWSYLWILIGIFLYAFGTFFISSIFEKELRLNIWFIQNVLNMVTYLLFAKGFITMRKIILYKGNI
jgi:hypothetical protein